MIMANLGTVPCKKLLINLIFSVLLQDTSIDKLKFHALYCVLYLTTDVNFKHVFTYNV